MTRRVISFHYTLTDAAGKVLDSSKDRATLSFMEGAGQIIPGLERGLAALKKGDKKRIEVPAAEAYGDADLIFDVELTDVREATSDEISHGHAHGEGGHSHS
ncbi:MAG: FKBP-type peptidyl-prolyl cis-trans isomerase [Candidatus Omnitrophota bacterium]